jgi:predicted SAM-dependent methyltransferase
MASRSFAESIRSWATWVARLPRRVLRRLRRTARRALGRESAAGHRTPAGTAAADGRTRLQIRRDFVFATADRSSSILEIGPAHNPILPKRDGFNTRTADYTDRDGLVAKYREFAQYSPDDIEDVDYIIPVGAPLSQVVHEQFDVVLASHVLEHTISVIDFLNDCASLLAPNGVLSLVVPDHRYCFDRFRERSSISRVIDVSLGERTFHTVGTMTEFALNAVRHGGSTSWAANHKGTYEFVHDLDEVRGKAAEAATTTSYIDVHNWVFTPNHLRLLLDDLSALGLISLREVAFQDTIGHEFFLNLRANGPGPGLSRAELVMLADAEARGMDVPVFAPVGTTSEFTRGQPSRSSATAAAEPGK